MYGHVSTVTAANVKYPALNAFSSILQVREGATIY